MAASEVNRELKPEVRLAAEEPWVTREKIFHHLFPLTDQEPQGKPGSGGP